MDYYIIESFLFPKIKDLRLTIKIIHLLFDDFKFIVNHKKLKISNKTFNILFYDFLLRKYDTYLKYLRYYNKQTLNRVKYLIDAGYNKNYIDTTHIINKNIIKPINNAYRYTYIPYVLYNLKK